MEESTTFFFEDYLKKLDSLYKPVVFTNTVDIEQSSIPLLADSLSNSVVAGLANRFVFASFKLANVAIDDYFNVLKDSLRHVDSVWEQVTGKKDYKNVVIAYNSLLQSINNDFDAYKSLHEDCLQRAKGAVDQINRQKTLMKNGFLYDLYELFSKENDLTSFKDFDFEQLDLRKWPINEQFNIIEKQKLSLIKDLEGDFIIRYMTYMSSICGIALSTTRSIVIRVSPWLIPAALVYSPVRNSFLTRRVKKKIKELEPKANLNQAEMIEAICKIDTFAAALENIASIYKAIIEELRPMLRDIIKAMNSIGFNFDSMPQEKKAMLFTIKELFKDLVAKQILPAEPEENEDIPDMKQISDDISIKYIELKEQVKKGIKSYTKA